MGLKLLFFLVLIISFGIPVNSFSDNTYRGDSFERELMPDGKTRIVLGLPERIDAGNGDYTHPYIKTETVNEIKVETGTGSFVFDKSTCMVDFFNGGRVDGKPIEIGDDSFLVYGAALDTNNWQPLTQVNNAACTIQVIEDGNNIEIRGTKQVSGQGKIVIKYIKNMDAQLKVELELTNLNPAWNNHKVGLKQTIQVPDDIKIGDTNYHLPNYSGTHITRQWLIDHKESFVINGQPMISFLNTVYDFSLGWKYVDSLDISYVNGKSLITINYFNHNTKIAPNQTLIIDPTYSSNDPMEDAYIYTNTATGAACPGTTRTRAAGGAGPDLWMGMPASSVSSACYRIYSKWDITSIPDSAGIITASFKFDVPSVTNARVCDFTEINTDPSSPTTAASVWTDIGDGTVFVNDDSNCTTAGNNKSIDLGTSGVADIQDALLTRNWWAVGGKISDESRDTTAHYDLIEEEEDAGATPKPTLEIFYVLSAVPYYLRTVPITTDSIYLDWIWNSTDMIPTGFKIEYQDPPDSAWAVLVADTGSTDTEYIHSGMSSGNWVNYRVYGLNSTYSFTSSPSNESNNITLTDPNMCLLPNALWLD